MSIVNHLPRARTGPGKRPASGSVPGGRHLNSIGAPYSAGCAGDFDIQEPCGVAPEDRPALVVIEPGCPLDKADRIDFAHVGRVIGSYQHMVRTVLLDEIFELMVGVEDC